MRRFNPLLALGALVAFFPFVSGAGLFQPVSAAGPSAELNPGGGGDSGTPLMTPDGRFVLFASTANNLALMSNGTVAAASFPARFNVFLRDRNEGTTVLVSQNLWGTGGGNGDSFPTGISTNGRYALFESSANDLVPGDTNNVNDVFVRDVVSGVTLLVSAAANGGVGSGVSRGATITPDGRFVAFVSAAANLVADDTNAIPDVFVRDMESGTTVLASPDATAVNVFTSASESPELSEDGRYVAFYSTATNLVPGVATSGEIYVRDFVADTTLLASLHARQALFSVKGSSNAVSYNHALSADGKFVAYTANLVTDAFSGLVLRYGIESGLTEVVHTNALMTYGPRESIHTLDISPDGRFTAFVANTQTSPFQSVRPGVVVWDAQSGSSTIASRNLTNGIAIGLFHQPVIHSTGRFVCFAATAENLTTNALNPGAHVYVRDLLLNETTLIDVDAGGVGFGVLPLTIPQLSADGQSVAFEGFDLENSANKPRRYLQVFARNFSAGTNDLISARHAELANTTADGPSVLSASVSGNGRFIAFASLASNLTAQDTNLNRDIFIRDLREQTTVLASVATNGFSANGMSFEPAISRDGRFVAFTSTANNLAPMDSNARYDVFVFDAATQNVVLGSVATNGTDSANNSSFAPFIGENGNYLFFRSRASNLAPGSFSSGSENLFWRDLQTGTTVALTTGGVTNVVITPDGRFAAYQPVSGTLLYVWDSVVAARIYTNSSFFGNTLLAISPGGNRLAYRELNTLTLLERTPATNWAVGSLPSSSPRAGVKFSGNNEYLTYASSTAQGLSDTNGTFDVYLYHIPARTKTVVSRAFNPAQTGNGASDYPDIGHDGRFVAYRSAASDIVPNDTNDLPDIFLYDQLGGTNRLLSANQSGASGNGRIHAPVFSGDGRTLVFPGWASDLVARDFNQSPDLFAFTFLYANITRTAGQPPVISWPATPGQSYQVQYKNQVDDPAWEPLEGAVVITGGEGSIQDTSPDADQRIYRIVGF